MNKKSLKNARVSKWYDDLVNSVDKCVFCDLKEKYIISKRDTCVLTVSLFPYIDGQLMVIPTRHIEKFVDMTESEWLETKDLIDTGVKLISKVVGINAYNILYREGKDAGKSVGHLHLHVLPITNEFMQYDKDVGFKWIFQKIKIEPFKMAEKMRKELSKW